MCTIKTDVSIKQKNEVALLICFLVDHSSYNMNSFLGLPLIIAFGRSNMNLKCFLLCAKNVFVTCYLVGKYVLCLISTISKIFHKSNFYLK
jgi:hypothetical protein